MSLKQRLGWTIIVLVAAAAVAHPITAQASEQSYPWCTQEDILHCYYLNREQCEETVDYHGFCVPNPDYRQSKM
jgi:hypothetical protein